MIKNYEEAANKSGVYKITNTLSGKFYIGSCKRFKQRWREHERDLLKGVHFNPKLRNDFNKCFKEQENGNDDFLVFDILEIIEGTDEIVRRTIEKKYIDENYGDGSLCCNIRLETIQKQGPWSWAPEETRKKLSEAHRGNQYNKDKKHSEETKKKISEANKGNKHNLGRHHTEESKSKMSMARKGKNHWNYGKHHSKETRKKLSEANKGKHPTEETRKKLSESLRGKPGHYTGHKHSKETKKKMSKSQRKRKYSIKPVKKLK